MCVFWKGMDLQTARNIERLIDLLKLPECQADEVVEFTDKPPFGLRLEVYEKRLLITSWALDQHEFDLKEVLKVNFPGRFSGLPQRVFIIQQLLYISALCPPNYDAHQWFNLCQKQRQFLTQFDGGH